VIGRTDSDNSARSRFDLVISDLFAPANDCLETIGEIRRLLPDTPIVATARRAGLGSKAQAAQGERHLRAAKELGATHTLLKPFEIATFLALLRESLGGRSDAPAGAYPPASPARRARHSGRAAASSAPTRVAIQHR
jgi:CheY-like chemotaxis protein